jgi:hypothetical protein
LVTAGSIKLANLRARPQITAIFRKGWERAPVEGEAQLTFDQRRLETLSDENQRLRRKVKELEDLVATLYGLRRSELSGVAPQKS